MVKGSHQSIEQRVLEIVKDVVITSKNKINIDLNSSLKDELGMDSIDSVSLILALEDEFGGTIEDDESLKLLTVRDVVDHITLLMDPCE